ncbi:ATP-binding cassette domain-containing protein [Leptolyngbya sp. FACHB-261]|uniref:ATP-binding cassette domain-containing protein n=1 Tax=Leptolyngbya sp. FACHB-261 TaxID=2692806 RepID=UPI001F555F12|nr:ATP-binding cassette domain-containing protein [Leptolyngbya sp. FACHB-261]
MATTAKHDCDRLITVEQVHKYFPLPDGKGKFTVLSDVSLAVNAGEVVALLGRTGSGKSTLLQVMAGLIYPSEGRVFSNDKPLYGANDDRTAATGRR